MLETKEGQLHHKKFFQASSLHQCPANEQQLAAFPDTVEMIGSIQLGKCNPAGNSTTNGELYKGPYNDQYCKQHLEFNRKPGQGLQKTCNVCPLVSTRENLGHCILHQLKFPDGL